MIKLLNAYVNTNSDDQYGEYTEENDGVHQNGNPTGVHVPKLHHPDSRRQLKKQPRRQENEQRHRHDNRSPVCHLYLQEEVCFDSWTSEVSLQVWKNRISEREGERIQGWNWK